MTEDCPRINVIVNHLILHLLISLGMAKQSSKRKWEGHTNHKTDVIEKSVSPKYDL